MKLTLLITLCLFGAINANVASLFTQKQSGEGTYYQDGIKPGGHCSLYPHPSFVKSPVITVAINNAQYSGSQTCGMCIRLSGSGQGSGANPIKGPYVAIVDNECPECKSGDIDLGLKGDGRWKISWIAVDCPVSGGLQYLFQGSNNWYIKMQVRNHRIPVQAVQFGKGGKWYTGKRTSDNFFNAVGYPFPVSFPLQVRVQGVNNEWLTDTVPSMSSTTVNGKGVQFKSIARAVSDDAISDDAISEDVATNQASSPMSSSTTMGVVVVAILAVVATILIAITLLVLTRKVRSSQEAKP